MSQKIITINKKKDFDNVFKNGKNIKGFFLIVKHIENGLKNNRFAFLISKKVSKKAVIRNKIKRRLLESVKNFKTSKNLFKDIVFIATPKIKEKNFFEIQDEVNNILSKVN